MTRVKICGITSKDDALKAVEVGAWALGFIFYRKSPRFVSPYKIKKIIDALPPFVTPVGVFVNQNEGAIKDIVEFCGIHTVQLHGDETTQACGRLAKKYQVIKAFRVRDGFNLSNLSSYPVAAFLFDTFEESAFGGTGKTFNWDIIKDKKFSKPVILSGGLNPENVGKAVQEVSPYAVDVSSGVEKKPGKKDFRLLEAFCGNFQLGR